MRICPKTDIKPAIQGNYQRPTFFLGIPTFGKVSIEFAMALSRMQLPLNAVIGSMVAKGLEVGNARQFLAEQFLESKARYLLFLGDDNIPEWDSLTKLFNAMEADESWDMLSGLYHLKQPGEPVIVGWRIGKDGPLIPHKDFIPGEIIKVDNSGLDFIVIRREAMLKIVETPKPWFLTTMYEDVEKNMISRWTEDTYFFNRCRQIGLKFGIHTGVPIGHFSLDEGRMY